MTTFLTLPVFLRMFKEFISEAVSFHELNLILITFIHVTLSFPFASLTVALKFRWSNINEAPSSGTDHILIRQIQQWGWCFKSYTFSSISLYSQINHFSFCQRKIFNSWKEISQITPNCCSRRGVSSRYCVLSMSCADVSDVVGASEIALYNCLQVTELCPGQTLCPPVEVFPWRHLGINII